MPPGDLLPSPEVLCDNRAVPAGAQPMILWQAQRVGSTWVQGLLNSHPEIEMQSEIYNYCPDAACLQRMCGLFTKPQHAADRVRGFKQKFFYCGGGLQKNWKVCLPADAGLNALERCLLPNDPEVSTRDNIKTIIRRHQHSLSHQMFTHVGAKIVCMLLATRLTLLSRCERTTFCPKDAPSATSWTPRRLRAGRRCAPVTTSRSS